MTYVIRFVKDNKTLLKYTHEAENEELATIEGIYRKALYESFNNCEIRVNTLEEEYAKSNG